jgi:excisionase family DNA binding protein
LGGTVNEKTGLPNLKTKMQTVSHATKQKKNLRIGNGCLLTTQELAVALGESPRTIITWRHQHRIPYLDLGHRSKRYRLEAVMAALAKGEIKVR